MISSHVIESHQNWIKSSFIPITLPYDQYYILYSNYKNDWSAYFCAFLFPLSSVFRILYSLLALLFESCMFSLLALILPAFVAVFLFKVHGGSGVVNSTSVGQVFSFVGLSHIYMVIVIINNHVEQQLALISHVSLHIRFGNSNTLARGKRHNKEAPHSDRLQIFHWQMRQKQGWSNNERHI